VLAIALSGCGTSGSGTARVGESAPEITGTALEGSQVTLASLRGRPVIVNFWGSWCVPCRQEMPRLKSLLQRHASEGLAILGVLYKDDGDPARQFVASFGGTWPNLLDPDGSIARAYRVVGAPQSYFIDRQGILRSIQVGEILDVDFDRQYPAIVK
jgi:cytochrome c biogenesis protein CcmG/thiol:disulfide interchange protein DsbE